MIQIARTLRVLAGGLAAGAIGVTTFAAATASADPVVPAPPPAPAVAAPAPANIVAAPGQAPGNRLLAAPPAANPYTPPNAAAAPAVPVAPAPAAATPAAPTQAPAVSGTIRDYLQSKGVKLEAQKPQGFKALDITLPVPPRWTQVPDPNVPDAFAVIADRRGASVYSSNAQVVVYKLVGNLDPKEAITHGFVDSQQLLAWQTTNASMADFGGFPSSVIEGTYRDGDMLLNTSRRHVIATSGHDKYLVSLSVTTDRAVAVADAPATDAIINGFRVTAPGTVSPAQGPGASPVGIPAQAAAPVGLPPQTAAAAPVGTPAQTAAAAPVGLPAQPAPPYPAAGSRPAPNLLTMVPGLPPLPNFSFLQH
ncbi:LpqN/LpqT family lipoprotein [Mycobacterium sp.]|uniref:LpqN/LpqT family lipoprotein n=1 Tax=Mycobacterium sp. TaxID=1785 RepID=UPI002C205B26|nr:LpqN/LpqT family lipoprotein [Mycobacterium sp.]HTY32308.1 LpqN/LpqT family lipoprotein [Mycobacterium sp.]